MVTSIAKSDEQVRNLQATEAVKKTDAELDDVFSQTVFAVALSIAGIFFILGFLGLNAADRDRQIPLATLAFVSGLLLIVAGIAIRNGTIRKDQVQLFGFGMTFLAVLYTALLLKTTGEIIQSTHFALTIAGAGFFFRSKYWLALALAFITGTWFAVARTIATPHELAHFGTMLFIATVLSSVAFAVRQKSRDRLTELTRDAVVRKSELQDALAQAHLYAAAAQDSRAKTEFLANMSHELRTPLNAILGFSEIVAQEMFGPLGNKKYTEYMEYILGSGRHLLSLVNDILDLSRIQLDTNSLNVQRVDVAAACRNCLAIVRERAARGQLSLTFRPPPTDAFLETDKRRLKQIVINLLTNAIKFTPAGGKVVLEIETMVEGGGVVVKVIDTGIGMSAEEIEKAVAPFWQADAGLNRNYDGTGLGLALVKEISEVMKIEFELQSEPGKGTTASLRLPSHIAGIRPNEILAA